MRTRTTPLDDMCPIKQIHQNPIPMIETHDQIPSCIMTGFNAL